jgi:hypothetical protein
MTFIVTQIGKECVLTVMESMGHFVSLLVQLIALAMVKIVVKDQGIVRDVRWASMAANVISCVTRHVKLTVTYSLENATPVQAENGGKLVS